MTAYIIRRMIIFIPMLLLVSFISFVIIQLPPGSFVEQRIASLEAAGYDSSLIQVEQLKQRYGLDMPMHLQYLRWIWGIVTRGDFGESFAYDREVSDLIWSYLGNTILISACSLIFIYVIAIPLGTYAALKKYSAADHAISFLSFIGMSLPDFLLALFLLVSGIVYLDINLIGLYSPQFQFAPWSFEKFLDLLKHLPIPAAIVAVNGTAGLLRIMRGSMLDTLAEPFVRAARAKGLPRRTVMGRHALRVAINPLISILGMSLPGLISGSAIISIVLNLPTAGYLLFESLKVQDMYLAGSLILLLSAALLIGNLLADIALALADPRIRYE